jgi:hypothetical protein
MSRQWSPDISAGSCLIEATSHEYHQLPYRKGEINAQTRKQGKLEWGNETHRILSRPGTWDRKPLQTNALPTDQNKRCHRTSSTKKSPAANDIFTCEIWRTEKTVYRHEEHTDGLRWIYTSCSCVWCRASQPGGSCGRNSRKAAGESQTAMEAPWLFGGHGGGGHGLDNCCREYRWVSEGSCPRSKAAGEMENGDDWEKQNFRESREANRGTMAE